jgi:hypothetical protein
VSDHSGAAADGSLHGRSCGSGRGIRAMHREPDCGCIRYSIADPGRLRVLPARLMASP